LTPGGAFAAADSLELELDFDDEDEGEDEPFEQGQLAASGGTMQFDAAITRMTVPLRFAIDLLIRAYLTENGTSREEKDKDSNDNDCCSCMVKHGH
jgi:hypothetical protein